MNMKAAEFDRIFDEGEEDILQYLDLSKASRPGLKSRKDKATNYYYISRIRSAEVVRLSKHRTSNIKV